MKRLICLPFVFVFMITLAGCGYTTATLLPPKLDFIYIDNFVNDINPVQEVSGRRSSYSYWPGLETDITRAVIDGFIFDRHLDVKRESDAALSLKGTLTDFRQFPLSYDKSDNVDEFRIEILVNIELYNNLDGEVMWKENGFMGQTSYTIAGPNAKTEAQAVRDAVNDLAKRIVERVIEAW